MGRLLGGLRAQSSFPNERLLAECLVLSNPMIGRLANPRLESSRPKEEDRMVFRSSNLG
jgi:hypothetical protein